MSTKAEIKLKFFGTRKQCREWAVNIIGQDPMGMLERPVILKIGNWEGKATVDGYSTCSQGAGFEGCEATLTLSVW